MKIIKYVIVAGSLLAMSGPVLAQEATAQPSEEQAAADAREAARQNTRMSYSRDVATVGGSVVDQFTQARNDRIGATVSITRPDGR